jgi:hypothetical protein
MSTKVKTAIKVTLALTFMASVGINVIQYRELKSVPPQHEYQMDIVGEHAIAVYDGITKLGTISYDLDQENPTELDNLIILNNE